MLQIEDVSVIFGGLAAVRDVSFKVERESIVGLIGPNGAGKTTIFNAILGVYPPTNGQVSLDGERIDRLQTHEITRKGIGRTFQNLRLFKTMTVMDNIKVALQMRYPYPLWQGLLRTPLCRRQEQAMDIEARRLLDFFELKSAADKPAGDLAYGQQKYLEIARAYALQPKYLLLDEPAAGLNDTETERLTGKIREVMAASGCGVLLIEHDMGLVMEACERIVVLEYGQLIAEGDPAKIQNDPRVIEAYLGTAEVG